MFKNLSIGLLILITSISIVFTFSLNTKSYSLSTIITNAQNADVKSEPTKRYNKLLAFDFYKANFKPVIKESVIKLNNYNVEKKRQEEERIRKEAEEKAKQEAELQAKKAEEARIKQLEIDKQIQATKLAEAQRQAELAVVVRAEQVQASETPKTFSGDIRGYAQSQVCARWSCDHWAAFDFIVNKESTWNMYAKNPSSGALGLCQNNPYSRAIGDDYRNNGNVQVDWCINYIAGRYGNPISAKSFWLSHNWF